MTGMTRGATVHLIALGGTIASVERAGGRGVTPALAADDLVARIPALADAVTVSTEQLAQTPSPNLTTATIAEVYRAGRAAITGGAAGVVVTQGTDTLEETAFLLSLFNDTDRPFVVTGAMRNPTLPGADGTANIHAAVLAAADPGVAALSAAVVFNDEIHDPWFVRKSHTSNPATFTSGPAAGPLGWVGEGRVRLVHLPAHQPTVAAPDGDPPPIALLSAALGDDGRLLGHLTEEGYAGLVVEGMGGGHVPEALVPSLARLAGEIPVVLASRVGSGEILRGTYAFPGSEVDLLGRGLLPAGHLTSGKARLLLGLLLASPDHAAADLGPRWAGLIDAPPTAATRRVAPTTRRS